MENLNKKRINGDEAEAYIFDKIKRHISDDITLKQSWDTDIVIRRDKKRLKIEVKSAQYKVKNGKNGLRTGKFYFIPTNLERPDYFAFVITFGIKKKTYWVRGDVIRQHFRFHNTEVQRYSLGIPLFLSRISKVDFGDIIEEWLKDEM